MVIGVVSDAKNQSIQEPSAPQVFIPYVRPSTTVSIFVRTTTDPARLLNMLRHEIQAVNPQAALIEPDTLEAIMGRVFYARPRFSLLVLGIFACTGVVLVAFGVYGVLAYTRLSADARDCDPHGARRRPRPRRPHGRPPRSALDCGGPRLRDCREPGHQPAARQPAVEHVTPGSVDVPGRALGDCAGRRARLLGAREARGSRRAHGGAEARVALAAPVLRATRLSDSVWQRSEDRPPPADEVHENEHDRDDGQHMNEGAQIV